MIEMEVRGTYFAKWRGEVGMRRKKGNNCPEKEGLKLGRTLDESGTHLGEGSRGRR